MIHTDKWKPSPDNSGRRVYDGQRKAQAVFDDLEAHLTSIGYLTDEYFLFDERKWGNGREFPSDGYLTNQVDYGGSEESVTVRRVKSHEYLFLFAKSQRYYFDHKAIREPAVDARKDGVHKGSAKYAQPMTDGGTVQSLNRGNRQRCQWEDGQAQNPSVTRAAELLGKSADSGNEYARYTLGKLLMRGELVPKDVLRAEKLLLAAAKTVSTRKPAGTVRQDYRPQVAQGD
jgi:hypothetical protein